MRLRPKQPVRWRCAAHRRRDLNEIKTGSYKFAASITKVADGQATLSVYGYDSYLPEDIDALQEGSVFGSTTRQTPP